MTDVEILKNIDALYRKIEIITKAIESDRKKIDREKQRIAMMLKEVQALQLSIIKRQNKL